MRYEIPFSNWLVKVFSAWLLKQTPPQRDYLSDYNHIRQIVKPADVLLIEGRYRLSSIIRHVTLSPWTHAALYIGSWQNIENEELRKRIHLSCACSPTEPLVIESLIGKGTIISPLKKYDHDHIRICRPVSLTTEDAERVTGYAIEHLGMQYNLRHVFDLARFIFPWSIYPRKWRSSLFQHNALKPTKEICSSLIAEAFQSVRFPILPVVIHDKEKGLELVPRNPRLYTPSDFDFSPYFDIIKYPIFPLKKYQSYQDLPWIEGFESDDFGVFPIAALEKQDREKKK